MTPNLMQQNLVTNITWLYTSKSIPCFCNATWEAQTLHTANNQFWMHNSNSQSLCKHDPFFLHNNNYLFLYSAIHYDTRQSIPSSKTWNCSKKEERWREGKGKNKRGMEEVSKNETK